MKPADTARDSVAAADLADDAYRLAGIQPTVAPSGSAGRDWLMYRIAQGTNMITGYRRGDVKSVTAEVERIVSGLNERRIVKRGRVDLKPNPAAVPERASKEVSPALEGTEGAPLESLDSIQEQ